MTTQTARVPVLPLFQYAAFGAQFQHNPYGYDPAFYGDGTAATDAAGVESAMGYIRQGIADGARSVLLHLTFHFENDPVGDFNFNIGTDPLLARRAPLLCAALRPFRDRGVRFGVYIRPWLHLGGFTRRPLIPENRADMAALFRELDPWAPLCDYVGFDGGTGIMPVMRAIRPVLKTRGWDTLLEPIPYDATGPKPEGFPCMANGMFFKISVVDPSLQWRIPAGENCAVTFYVHHPSHTPDIYPTYANLDNFMARNFKCNINSGLQGPISQYAFRRAHSPTSPNATNPVN